MFLLALGVVPVGVSKANYGKSDEMDYYHGQHKNIKN